MGRKQQGKVPINLGVQILKGKRTQKKTKGQAQTQYAGVSLFLSFLVAADRLKHHQPFFSQALPS